jgi:hypothetical protein
MNLRKEHLNPDFWREKAEEYVAEDMLKPSYRTKLKIAGSALASIGTCLGGGVIVPCLWGIYRQDNLGGLTGEEERISKFLLNKGYPKDKVSKLFPYVSL